MDYKVILEFDAFDCNSPEEAAKQIDDHLREQDCELAYDVIDSNGNKTLVDMEEVNFNKYDSECP